MVNRSKEDNSFEFVRVASLRAAQLLRGCVARVPAAAKAVVTAQREVAAGLVQQIPRAVHVPVLIPIPILIERPRVKKA